MIYYYHILFHLSRSYMMRKWTIQAAAILLGIMFQMNAANAEGYIYGKNEIDLSYEKD